MTRALLDASVLLALLDQDHVHHRRARAWIKSERRTGWASCAITQNGYVRIVSQPRYPNSTTTAEACARLAHACATEFHQFWSCEVALTETDRFDQARILGPSQITDIYLLALAVLHGGRLVTLDTTVPISAVVGATEDHLVIL